MSDIVHKFPPMQLRFIEGMEMGMQPIQAAEYAGSENPRFYSWQVRQDEHVQRELARIEAENRESRRITREKVQDIVLDAVEMARTMEQPADMIRGAQELNKMHGYYAPEKKEVEIKGELRRVQTRYENMDTEELLQSLGEEPDFLETEFERIEGDIEDAEFEEIAKDGDAEEDL